MPPVFNRENTWHDWSCDARFDAGVPKAQKIVCFKKELRDRFACACIDFSLEPVDIRPRRTRLGVYMGLGAYADGKGAFFAESCDHVAGVAEAALGGLEFILPMWWIATQGDDV